MNKLFIIGNLTRDPELRTTSSGIQVCSFTVAVNRRKNTEAQAQEADFFRVTAWRQLADICARYLAKGRKVSVMGAVTVSTYTGNDGQTRATMEVTADDVEFLSAKTEESVFDAMHRENVYIREERRAIQQESDKTPAGGFVAVDDEELPF